MFKKGVISELLLYSFVLAIFVCLIAKGSALECTKCTQQEINKFYTVIGPTMNPVIPVTLSDIPASLIVFKVNETQRKSRLFVRSGDTPSVPFDHLGLSYFEIATQDLDQKSINTIEITLKVSKQQLLDNKLEAQDIVAYQYLDSWRMLPTALSDFDETFNYYKITPSNFGEFAISSGKLKNEIAQVEINKQPEKVEEKIIETQADENPKIAQMPGKIWIIFLAVIVLLGAIIFFISSRKDK